MQSTDLLIAMFDNNAYATLQFAKDTGLFAQLIEALPPEKLKILDPHLK